MRVVGFVGYKVNGNEPGQVQRDMQVEQGSASSMRVLGSTPAICSALVDKEKDRVARGVHPSTLEDGETLLVEWWVVLQLWNEAMAPFDALAEWGHEHYVYGESTGWHIVEAFLDANITRLKLAHGQYALTPDRVGGFAAAFATTAGGAPAFSAAAAAARPTCKGEPRCARIVLAASSAAAAPTTAAEPPAAFPAAAAASATSAAEPPRSRLLAAARRAAARMACAGTPARRRAFAPRAGASPVLTLARRVPAR